MKIRASFDSFGLGFLFLLFLFAKNIALVACIVFEIMMLRSMTVIFYFPTHS